MGAMTTNIDVDEKWLAVGKQNYKLNGIEIQEDEKPSWGKETKQDKNDEEDDEEEKEAEGNKPQRSPEDENAEKLLRSLGISLDDDDRAAKKKKKANSKKMPSTAPKDTRHRFIAADVFKELPRLTKFKTRYSVVILDPPALARTPTLSGGIFACKSEYPKLVEAAVPLVAKGGYLLCFNNTRSKSASAWESEVLEGGLKGSRGWVKVDSLSQDLDFRWKEGDERSGKYLKGLVVRKKD